MTDLTEMFCIGSSLPIQGFDALLPTDMKQEVMRDSSQACYETCQEILEEKSAIQEGICFE